MIFIKRRRNDHAMVQGVNSSKAAYYASGHLPPNYPVPAIIIGTVIRHNVVFRMAYDTVNGMNGDYAVQVWTRLAGDYYSMVKHR
jgi:hypothetical protein